MTEAQTAAYLELAKLGVVAVGIFVLGTTIVASIVFYKSGGNKAREFSNLIETASVLQLATVMLIVLASGILAFMGVIKSEGAVAIFSGVAGYVLGGLRTAARTSRRTDDEDNSN